MRYIFLLVLFSFFGLNLSGQTKMAPVEGTISYTTSQNVYVKFSSTKNIKEGDTLFVKQGEKILPALVVNSLSSISCVCSPISKLKFKVSDVVIARVSPNDAPSEDKNEDSNIAIIAAPEEINDSPEKEAKKGNGLKQNITGRVSLSSYSNFYSNEAPNSQKMRYTFSFRGNNLGNSKFSLESYISFVHSNTNWDEVKEDIFNGLKIYSLAAKYDFNKTTSLLLGRKINPKLSSVGAIDGLQFEKKIKSFYLGAIVGSRPDYMDYSINLDLFQYGAYVGHEFKKENNHYTNIVLTGPATYVFKGTIEF